jgi:hypothetical protein
MPKALVALLFLLMAAPQAAAQTPVDVALVLVVDASGSIDDGEFLLQKRGIAEAVQHPRVLAAIAGNPLQRLAIAYVEWGTPGGARTVVGWMIVEDDASAAAFGQAVLGAPRSSQSYNAIGDGIVHATALLALCPCEATRGVIDISGDNPDNRSLVPAPFARDQAVAAGHTVNALAITDGSLLGSRGKPVLVENYEANVIGGPGAFVMTATSRADFMQALLDKMVLEISLLWP